MQVALRPYATAGVVIAGASMIVVTPAAVSVPEMQARDIALTSGLITSIGDQLQLASENTNELATTFFTAPFPGLQQAIVNQFDLLQSLINDPTDDTLRAAIDTVTTNLHTVLSSFSLIGASDDVVNATLAQTLDGAHAGIFPLLAGGFTGAEAELINFAASPLSGILFGLAGPLVSPLITAVNSIEAITDDLTGSAADPSAALQTLLAAPADIAFSVFNGADLNLDALIPTLAGVVALPPGIELLELDLQFGGLLSPGSVTGPSDFFTGLTTGGSIVNALGLEAGINGVPLINVPGEGVGPIGALEGLSILVASELGWSSDWNGKGTAPLALNPLASLIFPLLPNDDAGGTAAISDFLSSLTGGAGIDDLFSELGDAFAGAF